MNMVWRISSRLAAVKRVAGADAVARDILAASP
jgi:hypothetical protein